MVTVAISLPFRALLSYKLPPGQPFINLSPSKTSSRFSRWVNLPITPEISLAYELNPLFRLLRRLLLGLCNPVTIRLVKRSFGRKFPYFPCVFRVDREFRWRAVRSRLQAPPPLAPLRGSLETRFRRACGRSSVLAISRQVPHDPGAYLPRQEDTRIPLHGTVTVSAGRAAATPIAERPGCCQHVGPARRRAGPTPIDPKPEFDRLP